MVPGLGLGPRLCDPRFDNENKLSTLDCADAVQYCFMFLQLWILYHNQLYSPTVDQNKPFLSWVVSVRCFIRAARKVTNAHTDFLRMGRQWLACELKFKCYYLEAGFSHTDKTQVYFSTSLSFSFFLEIFFLSSLVWPGICDSPASASQC